MIQQANNSSSVVAAIYIAEERKHLGPYVFQKTLGQGTFGKVKLATHQPTGQQVAIKILEKAKITEVSDIERVSRQIHILKLVRHSNIIQLYEIIETPKYLFLIMEYCPGGQLFDFIIKHEKLDQKLACKYFQQIINGIEYLHQLNIVHRDLKPENMLLDHHNNIKIADFGLSNTYSKTYGQDGMIEEKLKTACGSPCYAAPEMIAGKKYSGLKVDIWSSGIILYAMLTGNLPFQDPNTSHLYKKILSLNYKIPQQLSPEAKSLIKGIITTPDKRLTLSQIKAHSFYKLINNIGGAGICIGKDCIPVDQMIIDEMSRYGFQKLYTRKCIETNKHNSAATTYHLLLKQRLNQGYHSHADINSDNFNPKLIVPSLPINRPQSRSQMKKFIDSHIELIGEKPSTKLNISKSIIEQANGRSTPQVVSSRYSRSPINKNHTGRISQKDSSHFHSLHASLFNGIQMLALPEINRAVKKKARLY